VVVWVGDGVKDGVGDGVSEGRIVSIGRSEVVPKISLSNVGLVWEATCTPEHALPTIPRATKTRINQDRFNDSPREIFIPNSGINNSMLKLFAPTYWRGEGNHHNYATKPSRRGEQSCQILILLEMIPIALQP
jgi:hypothetical protein